MDDNGLILFKIQNKNSLQHISAGRKEDKKIDKVKISPISFSEVVKKWNQRDECLKTQSQKMWRKMDCVCINRNYNQTLNKKHSLNFRIRQGRFQNTNEIVTATCQFSSSFNQKLIDFSPISAYCSFSFTILKVRGAESDNFSLWLKIP
jgi:hypothetical protein